MMFIGKRWCSASSWRAAASGPVILALAAFGVLLAVVGNRLLSGQNLSRPGIALLAAGAAAFLGSAWAASRTRPDSRTEPVMPPEGDEPLLPPWNDSRTTAVLAAVVFGFAAYSLNGDNRFRVEGVISWAAAILAFMAAFWDRRPAPASHREADPCASKGRTVQALPFALGSVAFLLVLALAGFFRFYRLGVVPLEMNSDHVEKILDIRRVLNGQFDVFFMGNGGREPMQFYATAGLIRFVGLDYSFLTLKIVTATAGLLVIPATYLLTREVFESRLLALLTASLLAVSHWAIAITRIGLRFAFAPLLSAVTLLFLFRALRYNRRNDFLLCGLLAGLGMYTYQSVRFLPLALLACLGLRLAITLVQRSGKDARRLLVNSGLMAGVFGLVYIPMARVWVQFSDQYWNRLLTRSTGAEQHVSAPVQTLLGNVKNLSLMFNWTFDQVWVYNLVGSPAMDYVMGALLILGLGLVVLRCITRRDPNSAYFVLAFAILLAPSALALAFPRENPSFSRSSTAIPLALAFVALPLDFLVKHVQRVFPHTLTAGAAALAVGLLLAIVSWNNYHWYFNDYAAQYVRSSPNHTEIAAAIEDFAHQGRSIYDAYIKAWPNWLDHRAVAIELGDPDWNNLLPTIEEAAQHARSQRDQLYVLNPADKESLAWLSRFFPAGTPQTHSSASGHDFVTYFVPGADQHQAQPSGEEAPGSER